MLALFKKDFSTFVASLLGFLVMMVFLLMIGLFSWVFEDSNILDGGYAVLDPLFSFAPFILMFLIPAISMRLFSEEYKSGTIELLFTKPISLRHIVTGKFLVLLAILALLLIPTWVYYFSICQLSSPLGNVDSAATVGAYFGLFFLGSAFSAIGLYASSLTENQILAFVIGVFLSFVVWMGFSAIGQLFSGKTAYYFENISAQFHYQSLSRGVIDSRNLAYFLSIILGFLYLTEIRLLRLKK